MQIEYHYEGIPDKLVAQFKTGKRGRCFRRRSVMTNAGSRWELVCCTIERLPPGATEFEPTPSRRYAQVLLHEDLLTEEECLEFANDLHAGRGRVGECELEMRQAPQWQSQLLPLNNEYMKGAGLVVGLNVGQRSTRMQIGPLLALDQPYYPDIDEAGRDWLPFTTYHGHSDARNDQICFLLPENRAFFGGAEFAEPGLLVINVEGAEVNALDLVIKGAYWERGAIHHFEQAVADSKAIVQVSEDADRLEYYLLDSVATTFDFYREVRYWRTEAGSSVLGAAKRSLEAKVRASLSAGEGLNVEFKPFVDPDSKKSPGGAKSKLDEIAITAVAFANTDGGHIYLGVSDDCEVTGIEAKLCEWAKQPSNDSVIGRYLGALKSRIKTVVVGELAFEASHIWLDGALIAVIDVPVADRRPIAIRQDHYLYARSGASNRKVPPDQWREVLEPSDKSRTL